MTDFDKTSEQFKSIRSELAGDALPPSFAKLYSQYTRVRMSQPGLRGWRSEEFSERLADAVTLIDVGLYEREKAGEGWRNDLKRAGELLEWLSHPDLNTDRLPLRLLAAGVYQLAGYPALALGVLNSEVPDSGDSQILTSLLMADFPKLHTHIKDYWASEMGVSYDRIGWNFHQIHTSDFNRRFIDEIIKVLGILCAYMRWGDTDRLELAQQKLHNLSQVMLYGSDSYSWLLSKVVSEVVHEYVKSSMRVYVENLQNGVSDYGKRAFERYLRSNYRTCKSLAWYSQVRGVQRLLEDGSFALCTPTGSGKTTIAELAIIQSMFPNGDELFFGVGPIAMYLVPSRALASEVESKLGTVLGKLGSHSVKVTGLYGGIDWGPTDAWVTSTDPTVLICTYEKAEALIRFLGPLFLNRVSLVVIDEAHSVQFNGKSYDALLTADDRSLRLEMLANRLLRYVGEKRIIALSAVANENESLAHWVAGNQTSTPVVSNYRSTRQLIGRLEWAQSGEFSIFYDILNGNYLGFDDGGIDNVPYIQKPFAPFPVPYKTIPKMFINEKNGVSKRQRPYLFWAALQLAQPDEQGNQHSVLISITQFISGYAEDFLYVLNKTLVGQQVPEFFTPPSDPQRIALFEKCLNACEDYFGTESHEYQLLQKGIVVHHGNMPGLLARLLVELLQKRVVQIALATSTLSEGVNLPFETVIIPTLVRNQEPLPVSEFKNLVGRAGRPGWGTEGRTLVFLESRSRDYSNRLAHSNYESIIDGMTQQQLPEDNVTSRSPLGALMSYIQQRWVLISGSRSVEKFTEWLEKTAPLANSPEGAERDVEEALDSLDGYLLSLIVEQEALSDEYLSKSELEQHLIDVWRRTYAYYVMKDTELWERVFSIRGGALRENIYPDTDTRRRLYRTSVAPRFGMRVLDGYGAIRDQLVTGIHYSEWSTEERIKYIVEIVEQISNLGKFKVPGSFGTGKNAPTWEEILEWWLNPRGAAHKPTKNQVSGWIKFIKRNFEYLFNWGLGTVLALILDEVNEGALQETSIEDWPNTGLPWIVFWLKELMTWGTLDPVVALLLAHGIDYTRPAAELRAQDYYKANADLPLDEVMHPTRIKEWADQFGENDTLVFGETNPKEIKVSLTRDFTKATVTEWRVVPVTDDNSITWIDPAGYEMATCKLPAEWHINMGVTYDFILNTETQVVKTSRYL